MSDPFPPWLMAAAWGLLAGGALVGGALIGWYVRLSRRVVAAIMAFGAGVLVSALCFELVAHAHTLAGLVPTVLGFAAGALVYSAANRVIARYGARHRKRSGTLQSTEANAAGSGIAIAIGGLIDGVPESAAIGLTIAGGVPSFSMVAAIFISNLPEGLSSTAGMKVAGRSFAFVMGLWIAVAVLSAGAAAAGYQFFAELSPVHHSLMISFAAGGILTMLADTMIPEAFEGVHDVSGIVMTLGFLCSYALSMAPA